jgi:hypothetical protein
MRWYVLGLVSLVVVGCGGDGDVVAAQVEPPILEAGSRIIVQNHDHARVLTPDASTVLTVHLHGPDGAPLADKEIVFRAPERGPSGTFGRVADSHTFETRALTDAEGNASAEFVAGSATGAFLVDAQVAGTSRKITFGVTVTDGPAPAAEARTIRQFLTDGMLGGNFGQRALLHGPFLVPAGSEVSTNMGDAEDGVVFTAGSDSWIAWIDFEPSDAFEHPTRFFGLDSSLAIPEPDDITVVDANRWFELQQPGDAEPRPLLEPSRTNASTDDTEIEDIAGARLAATRDECVIIIYGPTEAASQNTSRLLAAFFRRVRGSRHVQDRNEPASFEDLKTMIQNAKDQDCPKLFLYMIGHGYLNGTPGITLGREDDRSQKRRVAHRDIAAELDRVFDGTGTELCVVVDSCFAARAIVQYQNRGFDGEFVAASADNKPSTIGSDFWYFSFDLLGCWAAIGTPGVDKDGDGTISLSEGHDWLIAQTTIDPEQAEQWIDAERADQEHGINSTNRREVHRSRGRTLRYPLSAGPRDWEVPDLELLIGQTGAIKIPRPPDEIPLPARGDLQIRAVLPGFAIAQLVGVAPGQPLDTTMGVALEEIDIGVFGVAPGATDYTVTTRGFRDAYSGTGTITVLAPVVVLDYDHGEFAAGTEIELSRIGGGRVTMGEPGCEDGAPHLHDAITIDGQGPYEDQNPTGCGHGQVKNYPAGDQ